MSYVDWGQWFKFSWVKGSVSSLLNHNQPHADNRDFLVLFGSTIKSLTCWKRVLDGGVMP